MQVFIECQRKKRADAEGQFNDGKANARCLQKTNWYQTPLTNDKQKSTKAVHQKTCLPLFFQNAVQL